MLKMILKNYKWSNFPEKNCEKKTLSAKNAFKAWRWNANSFLILFYQNGLIHLKGFTCIWKTGINAHISLRKLNLKLVKLPRKVSILSFQKNTNFVNE